MCDSCKKDCGLSSDKLTENKRTPHKHAVLIKAWADGAEIELKSKVHQGWVHVDKPCWRDDFEYRIKPDPSDLEKYGVEVGDVWSLTDTNGKFFVKYEHVHGRKVCLQNLYTGEGVREEVCDFEALVFRRGVVNKL